MGIVTELNESRMFSGFVVTGTSASVLGVIPRFWDKNPLDMLGVPGCWPCIARGSGNGTST